MLGSFSEFMATAVRGRKAAGTHTQGYFVPGAVTSTSIFVCQQPTPGKELERLPEEFRQQGVASFWTDSELLLDDTLTLAGETYRIIHAEPWADLGEALWKVIGVRSGN